MSEELAKRAVAGGDHPPECKWHKDWHACDCGLFTSKWHDCARCDEPEPEEGAQKHAAEIDRLIEELPK